VDHVYSKAARYYDKLYAGKDYAGEVERVRALGGPNKTGHGRDALEARSEMMKGKYSRPSGLRRDGACCCVARRRYIVLLIWLLLAPCISHRRARNATRVSFC